MVFHVVEDADLRWTRTDRATNRDPVLTVTGTRNEYPTAPEAGDVDHPDTVVAVNATATGGTGTPTSPAATTTATNTFAHRRMETRSPDRQDPREPGRPPSPAQPTHSAHPIRGARPPTGCPDAEAGAPHHRGAGPRC